MPKFLSFYGCRVSTRKEDPALASDVTPPTSYSGNRYDTRKNTQSEMISLPGTGMPTKLALIPPSLFVRPTLVRTFIIATFSL
jgi:hypothetical protein